MRQTDPSTARARVPAHDAAPPCRTTRSRPATIRRAAALVASLALLAGVTPKAWAQGAADMQELAKRRNCLSCHMVERAVVGPAFKDVAARYAGQKDAADRLAQKVINGGAGAWGVLAMPANKQVTEAEARQLVGWVLSQKP